MFGCAQMPPQSAESLGGTSWQLVKFQGSHSTVLRPDDKTKYTLAFGADGSLSARIDCNRGRGTWKSSAKNQLELGPMALTRAACLPGSLHDHRQAVALHPVICDQGRQAFFLSMMADGAIYEFEPL